MRHRKNTVKLNRTTTHRNTMFANMLKALIEHERIETTIPKARGLKRYADQMITLAKANDLSARRRANAFLQVRFNPLTPKQARQAKAGDTGAYNTDRRIINKLFSDLGPRFANRKGGYTRMTKLGVRQGDNTQTCLVEYLPA